MPLEVVSSYVLVVWYVLSCVGIFVTPWTVACQTPLSMEFSGQEYWSGLPLPSPRKSSPGIEPRSLALQVYSLLSEPPGKPRDVICAHINPTTG